MPVASCDRAFVRAFVDPPARQTLFFWAFSGQRLREDPATTLYVHST